MPNILMMTSVIGGGHVFRDLAIARELKKILPSGYKIIFASGGNAYEMLQEEQVDVEEISGLNFPAHCGTARFLRLYFMLLWSEFRQLIEIRQLVKKHQPVLVILDEYYFITDYFRLQGIPVVFMCDFVGVPHCSCFRSPLQSIMERILDWFIVNWLARRANRWIFIGDSDHIPRKDWRIRARNLGIINVEPITKLQYTPPPARNKARQSLGFREDERVVTVMVGCSGAGEYLLKAANDAMSFLKEKLPDLRLELMCGKGIDSGPLRSIVNPGVHVHDYVRNIQEFIAASDAVILQCGITSVTECIMSEVPLVVVPLVGHWEQGNTARYVAEKFGVKRIEADQVTAEILAASIVETLSKPNRPKSPFRGNGHIAAARAIAEVLGITTTN
jgi:UDP-N-acetylglucosamine:LPS N-acetylglucosamine transferase